MNETVATALGVSAATADLILWGLAALLALAALVLLVRAITGARHRRERARNARLAVVDAEEVDGRRRLVLVRRDGVEHLLMIGGPSDIVIESGIGVAGPATTAVPRPQTQMQVQSNNMAPTRAAAAPNDGRVRAVEKREPQVPVPAPEPAPPPVRNAVPSAKPARAPAAKVDPPLRAPEPTRAELDTEIRQLLDQMDRPPEGPRN